MRVLNDLLLPDFFCRRVFVWLQLLESDPENVFLCNYLPDRRWHVSVVEPCSHARQLNFVKNNCWHLPCRAVRRVVTPPILDVSKTP